MNMNKCPSPEDETPLRDRPVNEIAAVLQGALGQRIPAYAIHERDGRRIGGFARGEETPSEEAEGSLRDLAEVFDILTERQASPEIMRAWMIGDNPLLENAPLQAFHEGDHQFVANAARYV